MSEKTVFLFIGVLCVAFMALAGVVILWGTPYAETCQRTCNGHMAFATADRCECFAADGGVP